jgi:hypothetical protein
MAKRGGLQANSIQLADVDLERVAERIVEVLRLHEVIEDAGRGPPQDVEWERAHHPVWMGSVDADQWRRLQRVPCVQPIRAIRLLFGGDGAEVVDGRCEARQQRMRRLLRDAQFVAVLLDRHDGGLLEMAGHCDSHQEHLTHRHPQLPDNDRVHGIAAKNLERTHQRVHADFDLPRELTMRDAVHLEEHVALVRRCGVGRVVEVPDVVDRSCEIVPPAQAAVAPRGCIQDDFTGENIEVPRPDMLPDWLERRLADRVARR